MKNLIKILFLILLTTFNLSNWAIGGITNSGQAKPPVNRYAIKPIHPVTKVNPDFYRRPRPAGLMTPDNGQKGLPFPDPSEAQTKNNNTLIAPPQNITGYYNHVQFNEFESQKREFIRSEALKCEENVCQVTLSGLTLLYDPNYPNPDYARKFKAFIYKNPSIKIQKETINK